MFRHQFLSQFLYEGNLFRQLFYNRCLAKLFGLLCGIKDKEYIFKHFAYIRGFMKLKKCLIKSEIIILFGIT